MYRQLRNIKKSFAGKINSKYIENITMETKKKINSKNKTKGVVTDKKNTKKRPGDKKQHPHKNKIKETHTKENKQKNKETSKEKDVEIKKSFRNKTFKKDELKKTSSQKIAFPKTSHLWLLLFLSILAVVTILFVTKPEKLHLTKKPKPQLLRVINDEAEFLKIKDALLTNAQDNLLANNALLFQEASSPKQQIVSLLNNKYLAILKRGKIFIVNQNTNKYVSQMEISPIPKREKEDVSYKNIFGEGGVLFVSGYRTATGAVEIASFKINSQGTLTRGMVYNIPNQIIGKNVLRVKNGFVFQTTRNLTTTSFADISKINIWDRKSQKFTEDKITKSDIFFNNNNLANAPLLHSFTICKTKGEFLIDCQQKHLLDDEINSQETDGLNIYFWISQETFKDNPSRIAPSSRLYRLPLTNPDLRMIQVEGRPVDGNSFKITDKRLEVVIYQNNNIPPAWHQDFTESRLAFVKISPDDFREGGYLLIDKDAYQLLPDELFENKTNRFIIQNDTLVRADIENKIITIFKKDNPKKEIAIDGKIISINQLGDNRLLLIFEKDSDWLAQIINSNGEKGDKLLLSKNSSTDYSLLKEEINIFKTKDKLLISLPIISDKTGQGQLLLLLLGNNTWQTIQTLALSNKLQNTRDGCQNNCQQDWRNLTKFFTVNDADKNLYAIVGSYLKLFTWNTPDKLKLLKTFNYTFRPTPQIILDRARARKPVGAKVVNGRYVCKKDHDYVGKSKKRNKGYLHLDMECCLDPDEYPNPWCTYRPGELSVTNLRFADYHGKVKRK